MQTEKSQPSGQRIVPETGKSRYRHYPFILGFEFLGLLRRPMLDFISPVSQDGNIPVICLFGQHIYNLVDLKKIV